MKKRQINIISAVFSLLLILTSCGASKGDYTSMDKASYYDMDEAYSYSSGSMNGMTTEAYEPEMSYESGSMYDEYPYESTAEDVTFENDLMNRKIIKNASLSFETRSYDEFIVNLSVCVKKYGGYIQDENSYGESLTYSSDRRADFTLRIPMTGYDAFMNEACNIGNVTFKSESANDVTLSYVDTESRIKSIQTEYDTLIGILEKAEKLEDVITIQERISEVTYQLESYKSQLRLYDDLISYCTVNINVHEVERETVNVEQLSFGERVAEGFNESITDVAEDLSDFAMWFIVSIPYFLIWGILIIAAVLIIRVVIRKKRIKKMEKLIEAQKGKEIEEKKTADKAN